MHLSDVCTSDVALHPLVLRRVGKRVLSGSACCIHFSVYVHSFVRISGKFACVAARPERSLPSHTFPCLVGRPFLRPSTLFFFSGDSALKMSLAYAAMPSLLCPVSLC